MKAHTLFDKAAAGLGTVALALFLGACSHNQSLAQQDQNDYGHLRTEQAAQQNDTTSGNTVATAPAPANTQAAEANPGTPAVISGPAKVDNTGRVYTSSSTGGAGNAAAVGLNTNVNIIPKEQPSTVTVTEQTPAPAPIVTETTTETATVTPVYTPAPAPAPIVETPAPMTSSTQETTTTTTTTHKRLRKD